MFVFPLLSFFFFGAPHYLCMFKQALLQMSLAAIRSFIYIRNLPHVLEKHTGEGGIFCALRSINGYKSFKAVGRIAHREKKHDPKIP